MLTPDKTNPSAITSVPSDQAIGKLEIVTLFYSAMPIGVTISRKGRIFISYPRLVDEIEFTVCELTNPHQENGSPVPYPNAQIHQPNLENPSECLLSVQGLTIDACDRLWLLDHAKIGQNPVPSGGPKLIGIDLETNQIFKKILFSESVASPTSTLNDLRVDLRWKEEGVAFITDSSEEGPNGIVVVDLATGRSWRKLNDHPTTKPVSGFLPVVEGQPMMVRHQGTPPAFIHTGSDGIALSGDGERLFYCPLASRHLYSVSIETLVDEAISDEAVAATVIDHGEKGASGGMVSDGQNRLYVTNYEHNAILRRWPDGTLETLAHDPRMLWPNSLAVGHDGYLYFSVDQWNRNPNYHNGQDLREKPYILFRILIDAPPVLLNKK